MTVLVDSYTIYPSPNAYLGTVLLRRCLTSMSEVELVRRPIFVPLLSTGRAYLSHKGSHKGRGGRRRYAT